MAVTMAKIGEHTNAPVLEFRGLSSDIKPIGFYKGTEIINGSAFLEIDTGSVFFYNAEAQTWIEQ